jgi:hypothetical protein
MLAFSTAESVILSYCFVWNENFKAGEPVKKASVTLVQ